MPIVGKCIRCGSCCLYGDAIEYNVYKKGESLVYSFKSVRNKQRNKMKPCVNLIRNPDKTFSCKDHKNRPQVCKQYPYTPKELIFERCGYKWIK